MRATNQSKMGSGSAIKFGVPLDGHDGGVGAFEALDGAVRSLGRDLQAFAEAVHRLVVQRVHHHRRAVDLPQSGGGRDGHLVLEFVGRLFEAAVFGNVLVQGPAPPHVHHLQAAADGQDRHAGLRGGVEQRQLLGVAGRFGVQQTGGRFCAVQGGVHVGAARQHDPVEVLDDPSRICVEGQQHRQPARLGHPPGVVPEVDLQLQMRHRRQHARHAAGSPSPPRQPDQRWTPTGSPDGW